MGCGVVIDNKKLSTRLPDETPVYIFATKNGKVIHVQGDIIPEDGYYPTISFFEKGISLYTDVQRVFLQTSFTFLVFQNDLYMYLKSCSP